MKHEFITGEFRIKFVQIFGQRKVKLNEYPKSITLEKHAGNIICRSPLEERVYKLYNVDKDVVSFKVEPYRIPYEFDHKKRLYIPDVLVHFKNGEKHLIEIKTSGEIDLPLNKAKFLAARLFCEKKGYIFRIEGIYAEYSNYRSTGHYGWNRVNDQASIVDLTPTNNTSTKPSTLIKPTDNKTNSNYVDFDFSSLIMLIFEIIIIIFLLYRCLSY